MQLDEKFIRKMLMLLFTILYLMTRAAQPVFADEKQEGAENESISGVYENMKENSADSIFYIKNGAGEPWEAVEQFYRGLQAFAPFVAVLSFCAGGFIFILSKYNKARKRFALYCLMTGIPSLVIALVFGVGIMCGILKG